MRFVSRGQQNNRGDLFASGRKQNRPRTGGKTRTDIAGRIRRGRRNIHSPEERICNSYSKNLMKLRVQSLRESKIPVGVTAWQVYIKLLSGRHCSEFILSCCGTVHCCKMLWNKRGRWFYNATEITRCDLLTILKICMVHFGSFGSDDSRFK